MEGEDVGETDTPDFNKARGYLLGFSTVVLLLWYFGADLSAFKLLGNEIKLKENVKNVWLVLAGINFYLWLRLYQRTPAGSFRFDLPMHDLYEKTLIKVVRRLSRRKMHAHVLEAIGTAPETVAGEVVIKRITSTGRMAYYYNLTTSQQESDDRLYKIRDFPHAHRNEVVFTCTVNYNVGSSNQTQRGGNAFVTLPPLWVTTLVKWYVFVRGALVSPWFFDHVTPFVLGVASIGVALFSWWQINYL